MAKDDGFMYITKRGGLHKGMENMCVLYRGYEISCAFDDSCGKMVNLSRSDIRVFKNGLEDVTELFTKNRTVIPATLKNLNKVVKKLDRLLEKKVLPMVD
jgi:hypothetical protein